MGMALLIMQLCLIGIVLWASFIGIHYYFAMNSQHSFSNELIKIIKAKRKLKGGLR